MGMIGFILALALLGVALLAMALQKTYSTLTPKELKRRAREKDPIARVLYRAVAYGVVLKVLLWTVTVITAAGSFVLLSRLAPPILAFFTVAIIIAYGFVWMPAHKATAVGMRVAVWATPTVAWILDRIHPLLDGVVVFVQRHRPISFHTGLYDRDDLLELVEQQKHQADSRISNETLELLTHSLTFGDKVVHDCMVPRRSVEAIAADLPISPAMISELHGSGLSRFPVYSDSAETAGDVVDFVGTLYLRDLITLKHTGKVADVMQEEVFYVHEDHPLEQVLDAFLKTHHHLFIVVNSFEEFVGIITIEDIIEQILGCKIVDEFDQYDDIRAVAAHDAKKSHHKRREEGSEVLEHSVPDDETDNPPENPFPQGTLKHVIYEAGFRGEVLETAYGVAMAESSGDSRAHNDDETTGDDSYGLFQINMLGKMGPERRKLYGLKTNKELFDPLVNAQVAFELSQSGKDWSPWTMYTNGMYKQFVDKKSDHPLA
jgi:CBS domain containing-hemolysin-like protein